LGGFGIRYEVNTAAFERLRENGVFSLENEIAMAEIENFLRTPLRIGGRSVRYRFPKQRAARIWKMREVLRSSTIPMDDPLALREELMKLEGVGPKTASWVVRNLLGSDQVAILDVHIIRVCQRLGLFPRNVTLPRDYRKLEEIFLDFASVAGVSSAQLDATIWAEARTVPADAWRLT
jgi:thermostable 8-oxoguanine DNA glycosylase